MCKPLLCTSYSFKKEKKLFFSLSKEDDRELSEEEEIERWMEENKDVRKLNPKLLMFTALILKYGNISHMKNESNWVNIISR